MCPPTALVRDAVWPWISDWLQSPGFGGFVALVAGVVLYVITAPRRGSQSQKQHTARRLEALAREARDAAQKRKRETPDG